MLGGNADPSPFPANVQQVAAGPENAGVAGGAYENVEHGLIHRGIAGRKLDHGSLGAAHDPFQSE